MVLSHFNSWVSHEDSPTFCGFQAVPAGIQLGLSDDLARVQPINSGARWRAAGPAFVFFNKRISYIYIYNIHQIYHRLMSNMIKSAQIWANATVWCLCACLCWSRNSEVNSAKFLEVIWRPTDASSMQQFMPSWPWSGESGQIFWIQFEMIWRVLPQEPWQLQLCQLPAVGSLTMGASESEFWLYIYIYICLKMQQAAMQNLWWCLFMFGQFVVSPNISKLNANQSWR